MPRPLTVAIAVALFGFLLVGSGFTNNGQLCDYPAWVTDDVVWLPPGAVECHQHPTPATTEYRTALPWGDWLTVLVVAASAGLFAAALHAPRGRIAKVAAAYALFVAATVAWFFRDALVWAALAAIAAALILRARRWTVAA